MHWCPAQSQLTERALELLALPDDGRARLLLDLGCGSGLSGEALTEQGHCWLVSGAPVYRPPAHANHAKPAAQPQLAGLRQFCAIEMMCVGSQSMTCRPVMATHPARAWRAPQH